MLERRVGYFVAQSDTSAVALSAATVGEVMGGVRILAGHDGDYVHITRKRCPESRSASVPIQAKRTFAMPRSTRCKHSHPASIRSMGSIACSSWFTRHVYLPESCCSTWRSDDHSVFPGTQTRARRWSPIAQVATGSDSYSTYCHELGHAFGFRHPFGLVSSADDDLATAMVETSAAYGSPYDIMGVWTIGAPPGATPAWAYTSSFPAAAVAGMACSAESGSRTNVSRAQLYQRWPIRCTRRCESTDAAHPVTAGIGAPSTPDPWAPETPGTVLVVRGANEPRSPTGAFSSSTERRPVGDTGLTTAVGDSARRA